MQPVIFFELEVIFGNECFTSDMLKSSEMCLQKKILKRALAHILFMAVRLCLILAMRHTWRMRAKRICVRS